jgi:hypothetical protein
LITCGVEDERRIDAGGTVRNPQSRAITAAITIAITITLAKTANNQQAINFRSSKHWCMPLITCGAKDERRKDREEKR